MRKFEELSGTEQSKAESLALNRLLKGVVEGAVRFNDTLNGDDLQARIDAAIDKADKMQTPWFSHEYVLDTCREDLEGMARCDAESAIYLDMEEFAVHLD